MDSYWTKITNYFSRIFRVRHTENHKLLESENDKNIKELEKRNSDLTKRIQEIEQEEQKYKTENANCTSTLQTKLDKSEQKNKELQEQYQKESKESQIRISNLQIQLKSFQEAYDKTKTITTTLEQKLAEKQIQEIQQITDLKKELEGKKLEYSRYVRDLNYEKRSFEDASAKYEEEIRELKRKLRYFTTKASQEIKERIKPKKSEEETIDSLFHKYKTIELRPEDIIVPDYEIGNEDILTTYFRLAVWSAPNEKIFPPVIVVKHGNIQAIKNRLRKWQQNQSREYYSEPATPRMTMKLQLRNREVNSISDEIIGEFIRAAKESSHYLLDGNHRATAYTLTGRKIVAWELKTDEDVDDLHVLCQGGAMTAFSRKEKTVNKLKTSFEYHVLTHMDNILNLRGKVERLCSEEKIPQELIDYYKARVHE